MILDDNYDDEFINVLDEWINDDQKGNYLREKFPEEISMLHIVRKFECLNKSENNIKVEQLSKSHDIRTSSYGKATEKTLSVVEIVRSKAIRLVSSL